MSYSVSTIRNDSRETIFVGFFIFANAKNALLTWSDGTNTLLELTNGTVMLAPFDDQTIKYFDVIVD